MQCRQSQANRRKWFRVIKWNIYCFHTFKNICVCQRGTASKAVDCCSTPMVSRDLSRLRTSCAIMLCVKELAVNACRLLRTEIRHSVSTGYSIPLIHILVWCDHFCEQPDNVIFNRDTSLIDSFHCNNVT